MNIQDLENGWYAESERYTFSCDGEEYQYPFRHLLFFVQTKRHYKMRGRRYIAPGVTVKFVSESTEQQLIDYLSGEMDADLVELGLPR